MIPISDLDIARLLPLNVHGRVFVNGFPGAGNVLVARVSEAILKAAGANIDHVTLGDQHAARATHFLGPRYNQMLDLFRSAMPPDWNGETHFTHRQFGCCDFLATNGHDFLILNNLDLGLHLNTLVHSTHELPSAESYEAYRAQKFHVVPVVRHPLDMMGSLASKEGLSTRGWLAILALPTEGERKTALDAYFRISRSARLSSDDWVRHTAERVMEFYAPVAAAAKRFPPERYEDILRDPLGWTASFARRVGRIIEDHELKTIAAMIGGTEFRVYHLRTPAIDKWRRTMTWSQVKIAASTGLFETFKTFGYDEPTEDDIEAPPVSDDPVKILASFGLPEFVWTDRLPMNFYNYAALSFTFDPMDVAKRLGVRDLLTVTPLRNHLVISNNKSIADHFVAELTSAIYAQLAHIWRKDNGRIFDRHTEKRNGAVQSEPHSPDPT